VRVASFYSRQALTKKNKQHADRAPHLDRTNGVLLYHTTPTHGAQAGRGQVRSTRYVCALGVYITRVRVCANDCVSLFHSEAKGAIRGEQKDEEIEAFGKLVVGDRGDSAYHIV
jgi:hypothetical protein